MSTEIRSPLILWRSASFTAPRATWATWAPPPMMITRDPKIREKVSFVETWRTVGTARRSALARPSSSGALHLYVRHRESAAFGSDGMPLTG